MRARGSSILGRAPYKTTEQRCANRRDHVQILLGRFQKYWNSFIWGNFDPTSGMPSARAEGINLQYPKIQAVTATNAPMRP